MENTLQLHRLNFSIRAATSLRFPESDRGFKGSAWHGRIDHAIRRHPKLTGLLPDPARSGAPARYWIEAPEDRTDGPGGPFATGAYPAGCCFDLAIHLAGTPPASELVQAATEAINHAGAIDPALSTPPQAAAQRLCGRFQAEYKNAESFPLNQLVAPQLGVSRVLLKLEFQTMLRLDDGEGLSLAAEQLRRGSLSVPRLPLLAAKVFDRCQGLGLGTDTPWLMHALREAVRQLEDSTHQIQLAEAGVYPFDLRRVSARAGRLDPMGGLLGTAAYEGPSEVLGPALPLFRIAEWTRIGRKTGLGAGRIRATLLP